MPMATVHASVYFDGLCPLCSREIAHYQKMRGNERIRFVDITSPAFNSAQEGLDPLAVHRELHAKDAAGNIHTGVAAFILIWRQLDSMRWLVPIAAFAPVHFALKGAYRAFAKLRPYLPRKKTCSASPYCEVKHD
jgi:predicted DCC family thiol-disulfide oxidoreductase YuxK